MGAVRVRPGSGRIQGDGLPWSVLVQLAYGAEPSQVAGEIPSLKDQVFRVSIRAPGNDDAAARQMLKDLIASALGLKAQWQQEERSVTTRRPEASLLTRLLDQDGDGSALDDVARRGLGMLGGLFRKD